MNPQIIVESAPGPIDSAVETVALVERCRADLAKASADLDAARLAREALSDTAVDGAVRADELVRLCFRNKGAAQDRLDHALDLLARRREVAR